MFHPPTFFDPSPCQTRLIHVLFRENGQIDILADREQRFPPDAALVDLLEPAAAHLHWILEDQAPFLQDLLGDGYSPPLTIRVYALEVEYTDDWLDKALSAHGEAALRRESIWMALYLHANCFPLVSWHGPNITDVHPALIEA